MPSIDRLPTWPIVCPVSESVTAMPCCAGLRRERRFSIMRLSPAGSARACAASIRYGDGSRQQSRRRRGAIELGHDVLPAALDERLALGFGETQPAGDDVARELVEAAFVRARAALIGQQAA